MFELRLCLFPLSASVSNGQTVLSFSCLSSSSSSTSLWYRQKAVLKSLDLAHLCIRNIGIVRRPGKHLINGWGQKEWASENHSQHRDAGSLVFFPGHVCCKESLGYLIQGVEHLSWREAGKVHLGRAGTTGKILRLRAEDDIASLSTSLIHIPRTE